MIFKDPQGPLKDKIMIYKAKAMDGTRIRMFREWILWLFWSETFVFISKPKPDVCVCMCLSMVKVQELGNGGGRRVIIRLHPQIFFRRREGYSIETQETCKGSPTPLPELTRSKHPFSRTPILGFSRSPGDSSLLGSLHLDYSLLSTERLYLE